MDSAAARQYYRAHSIFTDPGARAALYADLPRDVPGLARVIQGVIIHPGWARRYGVEVSELDNTRFGLRLVEDLLRRIEQRHAGSLTVARPPADRIGAICRNFGVLLVSMLRQQGIPARLRIGFAGYFGGRRAYDHRIAEYWDEARQRWVLADPQMDDLQRRYRHITFDTLDIGPNDPFLRAGDVWTRCRAGALAPEDFGDSDTDIGMPPIRYALLHDFAALNKFELLGCDDWGELITKPEADLTGDDLAFLDRVAAVTLDVDGQLDALRALFATSAYGQTLRERMEQE
jgi:hypothetical protein